jgi:hypothetical protein
MGGEEPAGCRRYWFSIAAKWGAGCGAPATVGGRYNGRVGFELMI